MICKRSAEPTEHVRSAVYHDRFPGEVQATGDPAPETESVDCLYPTTSTFALLHVIGELSKATETGTAAAGEQIPVLSPAVYLSNKIITVGRRLYDRAEVMIRRGEADSVLKLEFFDYTQVKLYRQT
jgi:hypothetical protein